MDVSTLIANLGLTLVSGAGQTRLSDLVDDTRRVTPGSLFIARGAAGQAQVEDRWRKFIADAIERGATAIVAPAHADVPEGVSLILPSGRKPVSVDQRVAGQLAARFFGEPAKQLKLIGITGTNGKTTVATLTQYLINAAGAKCGLLGTVAIDHGSPDGPITAELTTPGAIDLHRHFAAMVANDCEACAMEVSSHALDQGRVDGLEFDVAVFTNLTQDHLDYHGTMENYAAAKAKLFRQLSMGGLAVLPREDPLAITMLSQIASGSTVVWVAADPTMVWGRDYFITPETMTPVKSSIRLNGGNRPGLEVTVPLAGQHNLRNLVQAIAAMDRIDSPSNEKLRQILQHCPAVPGRLEPIGLDGVATPAALVDYAHTPDALENVIQALRPLLANGGRLIVVFGCGGDRDRAKRPLMAQAACGLADVAVLTSDNPRTEDPQQILDDAIAGVPPEAQGKLRVEIDRVRAIESAILGASVHDTVLIAGKGHEDYQILGTKKIHFDDREHAAAALQKWVEANPT